MKETRLLITGGAGFIGSNLVRMALAAGHRVLNIDCLSYSGNLLSLADVEANENYQFLHADITDSHELSTAFAAFKPQAVLHLAAESHVDRSIDGPGQFIQSNIVGTFQLLQAALTYWRSLEKPSADAFRFVHVSTDEVFGSLGSDGKFTETTSYEPHSPYAATKAASDHLARAWHDTYGLPVIVTNSSNNYGPFQFPEKLIPVVILKCLHEEPIPVYGNGQNVRDWLYVDDHCRALLSVCQRGIVGETYAIGGNNELKNIDLVTAICDLLDELQPSLTGKPHREKINFVADRPGHDQRYAIDASKIAGELGWKPSENFKVGLRKTVIWYLENENWWRDIISGDYRQQRLGLADAVNESVRI